MFQYCQNIVVDHNILEKINEENIFRIRREARKTLLPPPEILVSEWANAARYINGQKYKTEDAPHTVNIMNWAKDPRVRKISIMGSAQSAKTDTILNIIGYFIDCEPRTIIIMFPTLENAKDFVKTKLDPMINETPSLRRKVRDVKRYGKNEKESAMMKKFPGGWLKIITGNSTAGTRGISAQVTIADDIDQLVIGQQKEGDPTRRLEKRTTYFKYNYLHINISTPTRTGSSRIDALIGESSYAKYHVQCPHCNGEPFIFETERLKWHKEFEQSLFDETIPEENRKVIKHYPETAYYPCPHCDAKITEVDRIEMLKNGTWIEEKNNIEHKGAWINEISSTISSFQRVAEQIIEMSDHPEQLEVLYNTVFGLPFDPGKGEGADSEELIQRMLHEPKYIEREYPFIVPNEILFGVMATDVQGDHTESMVWGVGVDGEAWLLLYQKIYGDIMKRGKGSIWEKVDQLYFADWRRKDGVKVPMLRHFVDSGYKSQIVYNYTRGRENKFGIWAVKGKGGYGVSLLPKSYTWQDFGRTKMIGLGSNAGKHQIYQMLKINDEGPNYVHFAQDYCDDEFFKQFEAERPVKKYTGLISYIVYEKPKRSTHNEVVDLMYYCYAAVQHVNPNYRAIKSNMDKQAEKIKQQKKIKKTEIEIFEPDENKNAVIEKPKSVYKPKRRTTARRA